MLGGMDYSGKKKAKEIHTRRNDQQGEHEVDQVGKDNWDLAVYNQEVISGLNDKEQLKQYQEALTEDQSRRTHSLQNRSNY